MKLAFLLPHLVIFLTSFRQDPGGGAGLADGQLYTSLEDVAKVHNLPLALLLPQDVEASRKGYDISDAITITCLVKSAEGWEDSFIPFVTESRDFFRSHTLLTNYNPHYFCANVPKFSKSYGAPKYAIEEGHVTPYSQFWMDERSAWHWTHRAHTEGGAATGRRFIEAKNMGFIFRVDVTGIKSRGRFLKGWYHLRVSLDCDHNLLHPEDEYGKFKQCLNNRKAYAIDKLMVTARGRILIPGKGRGNVKRPARRAWVGGIGEFVKDFPKCRNFQENQLYPYVQQQFMPCGAVQYSEAKYGNNFYYSRGWNGDDEHKGNDEAVYGTGQEKFQWDFHLNFRLDNSFCNRYYDLDFVANGIVMKKGVKVEWLGIKHATEMYPKGVLFAVQRSISTRFAFITSYTHHGPSYYENADPIPRHVEDVVCDEELRGEWEMNRNHTPPPPPKEKPLPGDPILNDAIPLHTASVTQGADLQLTNAPADATFGGAIKFIYNVPEDGYLYLYEKKDFGRRRTWTYPDFFVHGKIDPAVGLIPEHSIWDSWTDLKEFQAVDRTDLSGNARHAIKAAIQRVLHEFDWETWRAIVRGPSKPRSKVKSFFPNVETPETWQYAGTPGHITFTSTNPISCSQPNQKNCQKWCDPHEPPTNVSYRYAGGEYWPHPYYDATCVGLDVVMKEEVGGGRTRTIRPLGKRYETGSSREGARFPNKFEKLFPTILGRCPTNLYYNDGVGRLSSIAPSCNEFWKQYGKSQTWDPALHVAIEAQKSSGRSNWFKHYGTEGPVRGVNEARALCDLMAALKKEFGECPRMIPNPYTPTPPHTVVEALKVEEKKQIFKTTPAYDRGMMVAENPYTLYVYDSRVLHGLAMTIIVMFITPVSIFLARYFKETFMNSRVFLHRIWYFVHVSAAILTPLLFIVALWRIVEARALLGVSLTKQAQIHRVMGWTCVVTALLLCLVGGLRCMNRFLRGMTIFLHVILGFLFYLISLGLIILSIKIPGSPSADQDFSIIPDTTLKHFLNESIFIVVLAWLVFDLLIHIGMTSLQCVNDARMDLTHPRICFGAGIPVIHEMYRFDTPGRFCRIYVLPLYIFVALGCTIAVCCFILQHSPRDRGYGFMTCTHHGSGPEWHVAEKYLCIEKLEKVE